MIDDETGGIVTDRETTDFEAAEPTEESTDATTADTSGSRSRRTTRRSTSTPIDDETGGVVTERETVDFEPAEPTETRTETTSTSTEALIDDETGTAFVDGSQTTTQFAQEADVPSETRDDLAGRVDEQTITDVSVSDIEFDRDEDRVRARLSEPALQAERDRRSEIRRETARFDDETGLGASVGDGRQADFIAQQRDPETQLRRDAAEQFDLEEEDIDIEVDNGQLIARPDVDALDSDFTFLEAGADAFDPRDVRGIDIGFDDAPGLGLDVGFELDDGRAVSARGGDQLIETDLPTDTVEASGFVRSGARTAAGTAAVGAGAAGLLTAELGERAIDTFDIDTRDATVAAGTAVAVPEPITTTGGAAVLAAGGAAAGLGAGRDFVEIEAPTTREEVDRPEITAPAEADVGVSELDVGEQQTGEVRTPETGDEFEVTEIDTGDPTATDGEISPPTVDAQQMAGQIGQFEEDDIRTVRDQTTIIGPEDIEDTGPLVDIPIGEQQRQIREELERRQDFVREDTEPFVVDRVPVRFPGEQPAEPVDTGLLETQDDLARTDFELFETVGEGAGPQQFGTAATFPPEETQQPSVSLEQERLVDRVATEPASAFETDLGLDIGVEEATDVATALDTDLATEPLMTTATASIPAMETVEPLETAEPAEFAEPFEFAHPSQPQPPTQPGGGVPGRPFIPAFEAGEDDIDEDEFAFDEALVEQPTRDFDAVDDDIAGIGGLFDEP